MSQVVLSRDGDADHAPPTAGICLVNGYGEEYVPSRGSEHAAGLDLRAAIVKKWWIGPDGCSALIPCGFAMALPAGHEAQIRPRSGLAARHGVTVLNAPGTIDADYRGEVKVLLVNHASSGFYVTPGMRIAQMVIARVAPVRFEVQTALDPTPRGAGGFGSTGVQ